MPSPITPATGLQARLTIWSARRLYGEPIAESTALVIPTAAYYFRDGPSIAYRLISGKANGPMCELGWKSVGVLELTALTSIDKANWIPQVEEVDALLVDARMQARKIVEEAERRAEELDAAKARAEDALAQTEAEARAAREGAERDVAQLHAEAGRVRLVIDEFRNQWWELISDALKQLELHVPTPEAPSDDDGAARRPRIVLY